MAVQYDIDLNNEYSSVSLLTDDTLIILPDPNNTPNSVDRLIISLHQGTGAGIITTITWQATDGILWKDNNIPDGFDGNANIDQVYLVELWKDDLGTSSWLGSFNQYIP